MTKDIYSNSLSSNQLFILNTIRGKMDKSMLDNIKSSAYQVDDFIIYSFYDSGGIKCPFILDFGIKQRAELLNFYYNHSAPLLEIDLTNENRSIYLEAIKILLQSKVKEVIKYAGILVMR